MSCYVAPALIAIGALVHPALCADDESARPLSLADVLEKTAPAVVAVDCLGDNHTRERTTLGFLVSDDGKIAANQHALQGCRGLAVRLSNGSRFEDPDVIEYDTHKDLTLIRVNGVSRPVLALADSNEIKAGQVVYLIVRPGRLQDTLQQARVTGFRQVNGYRLVQVSVAISLDSSGGPILDDQGRVIAIADPLQALHVAAAENRKVGSADLGLAIPINEMKDYLNIKTETPFGAFMAAITQAAARAAGISAPTIITRAEPEYTAEARRARRAGTVSISLVVDEAGNPQNPKVVRSLGLGLDEKAIEAVQKWKFKPGTKDGKPVPVIVSVEVNFRLVGNRRDNPVPTKQ